MRAAVLSSCCIGLIFSSLAWAKISPESLRLGLPVVIEELTSYTQLPDAVRENVEDQLKRAVHLLSANARLTNIFHTSHPPKDRGVVLQLTATPFEPLMNTRLENRDPGTSLYFRLNAAAIINPQTSELLPDSQARILVAAVYGFLGTGGFFINTPQILDPESPELARYRLRTEYFETVFFLDFFVRSNDFFSLSPLDQSYLTDQLEQQREYLSELSNLWCGTNIVRHGPSPHQPPPNPAGGFERPSLGP